MDVVEMTLDTCIGTALCESVDALLDEFAKSAADGALQRYFGTFVSPEARFLGTDMEENWSASEFFDFARPYFKPGGAWTYVPRAGSRTLVESPASPDIVVFDEVLDHVGGFGECRGSGTAVKKGAHWFVLQYHLTIGVANALAHEVTRLHRSEAVFHSRKHHAYVLGKATDTKSFEAVVMQHLRMSGVYWAMTAEHLMDRDLVGRELGEVARAELVAWVCGCHDAASGGYSGNTGHDPHLLYTLSAVQILAMQDMLHLVDRAGVLRFVKSLQRPDGSFAGDKWGEIDTRFSYCALSLFALLGALPPPGGSADTTDVMIDVPMAVAYISSCQNFDGGFGAVPGAESHAGQIFCCVGALSIAHALDRVDRDLLCWWLCERQCDSGGLNGRPEKQADVCYSWWILSCLTILGRMHWIDRPKLAAFILLCQDDEKGGIADRPEDVPDIFHTYFGIAGLALLGYFRGECECEDEGKGDDGSRPLSPLTPHEKKDVYRYYDERPPSRALPMAAARRLRLDAQLLPMDEA